MLWVFLMARNQTQKNSRVFLRLSHRPPVWLCLISVQEKIILTAEMNQTVKSKHKETLSWRQTVATPFSSSIRFQTISAPNSPWRVLKENRMRWSTDSRPVLQVPIIWEHPLSSGPPVREIIYRAIMLQCPFLTVVPRNLVSVSLALFTNRFVQRLEPFFCLTACSNKAAWI
jgi:hypothetical protein